MLNWPTYEKQPSNESNAVGDHLKRLTADALQQSAANMRQYQRACAEAARTQRQEARAAALSIPPDGFNSFPEEVKEEKK
jgi:hypothetical protein